MVILFEGYSARVREKLAPVERGKGGHPQNAKETNGNGTYDELDDIPQTLRAPASMALSRSSFTALPRSVTA